MHLFYFNIKFLPLDASMIVWVQHVGGGGCGGSWSLGPISEMSKIPIWPYVYFMVITRWIISACQSCPSWEGGSYLMNNILTLFPSIYLIVIKQLFPLISHFPRQWGEVPKFWYRYIPKNRNAFLLPLHCSFIRHSKHHFHCLSVPS
jgi:hypothetical protein